MNSDDIPLPKSLEDALGRYDENFYAKLASERKNLAASQRREADEQSVATPQEDLEAKSSQKTKFIFVTGGVVSSLGKGLAAASLGTLLEKRGLKVALQKFDPYLNVDPGTMSPFQHGEVYVLDDGSETDLDLGHYERFTHARLSRLNNLTSGQVFENVIRKERKGEYLGATVQFIPHLTGEIIQRMHDTAQHSDADVLITEVGGTVGDLEAQVFLEALRQFALEAGKENTCFIHVTLLPYIRAAGEMKTKPTQQSVAKLREIGIQPDVIVCRAEQEISDDEKAKIAMFCNVDKRAVVAFHDVKSSIYECPLDLRRDKLDRLVCDKLGLGETPAPELEEWEAFVDRVINPTHEVEIAVVGKYIELQDAYKSVYEAFTHAGAANDCRIKVKRVDAEDIETSSAEEIIGEVDGILIPGGFGDRGIEGKIEAAKYARTRQIPYFGICLGMQIASIEFARNVCGLEGANSYEFDEDTPHPIIGLLEDQKTVTQKGGSMRLGLWICELNPDSKSKELYGETTIDERHRHRFEFNPNYRERLQQGGLLIAGTSPNGSLVEIVEIPDHPHYIAVQFHPEFRSKPNSPHPLFSGFISAALRSKLCDPWIVAANQSPASL